MPSQSRRRARALDLGGEDLAGVARAEPVVERDQPAVHPGADARVPDLGVDGVGEVDGSGALGEGDDPALGREDVDLVLVERDLEVGHELGGVGGLGLPVDDAVQPDLVVAVGLAVLVGPVRGDPVLGAVVHLAGADLHLEGLAQRPDHGGVQRLVQVELGHRDVVLEPALHRLPRGVDRAQRRVAVLHRVDEHPDAHQVEDVVEVAPLHDHLLVDAPEVLRAAAHVGVDAQLLQPLLHLLEHLEQVEVALGRPLRHHLVDLGVALGVQRGEGEVLELLLDLLHAEAVRERRVDVEGLAGDALLLPLRQGGQGAHVVEPVGELDDEDPEVLRHRHQHLAHGGGLLRLLGVEAHPVELGDPVDDGGHVGAELGLEVGEADAGVLDGVVQQRRGDGGVVEAELGHDAGHGQRVLDVGLARLADLPGVRVAGPLVGPGEQLHRGLGVAAPVGADQRLDLDGRGRGRPSPGQDPVDGGHQRAPSGLGGTLSTGCHGTRRMPRIAAGRPRALPRRAAPRH